MNYYENKVDKIITEFKNNNSFASISELYSCLLIKDVHKYKQVVKILSKYFENIDSDSLIYLDKTFRDKTSIDYSIDSQKTNIKDLIKEDTLTDKEISIILGLSSFHPYGYFREKALKELKKYRLEYTFNFFIIRLNDWVHEIRELSNDFISTNLIEKNIDIVIKYLALLSRISNWKRSDNKELIIKFQDLLKKDIAKKSLFENLKNNDVKLRKICYSFLCLNKDNYEQLLKLVVFEDKPFLRQYVYKKILDNNDFDISEAYIKNMLNEKYFKIRIEILNYLSKKEPEDYIEYFRKALLDKNFTVRHIARLVIKKFEDIDFIKFYLDNINKYTISSIGGLQEVGNKTHVEIIKKYLNHSNKSVIKESLKFLSLIDYDNSKEVFLKFLESQEISLSSYAKKIIKQKVNEYDLDIIYEIYLKSNIEHIKWNCSSILMNSIDKWFSIKYIIIFLDNQNEIIKDNAKKLYEKWLLMFNKNFTKPTQKQVLELKELINKSNFFNNKEKDKIIYLIS